jgi:hypothetical protein
MASVRLVVEGPCSLCGGGHDRWGNCCGLCSHGRRGLKEPLSWQSRQVRALIWPLFAWTAWVQSATVVAGTTGEDDALASVPLLGVGSTSHCGGGHYS